MGRQASYGGFAGCQGPGAKREARMICRGLPSLYLCLTTACGERLRQEERKEPNSKELGLTWLRQEERKDPKELGLTFCLYFYFC